MSQPPTAAETAPPLRGLSHLAFSVADLDAACAFWTEVLGFELTTRMPSLGFVVHRDARLGIGLTDHEASVAGPFDEHHAGLDHVALAVPDQQALEQWAARLDAHSVPHSPIDETDSGLHLNLRAPDNVPVELYVMSQATAEAFGLDSPDEAVAHPG